MGRYARIDRALDRRVLYMSAFSGLCGPTTSIHRNILFIDTGREPADRLPKNNVSRKKSLGKYVSAKVCYTFFRSLSWLDWLGLGLLWGFYPLLLICFR